MERKRHMVDISDDAWKKLERLASRLDATQFVYRGRPRYGKLLELAIEKLEDSTMEWTVEEVELAQDEWYGDTPEGEETIEWDSKKEWWKGDKLDKYKPGSTGNEVPVDVLNSKEWWLANPNITPIKASQAEQDMAQDMVLYGNAYISADTGVPIKAKDITFKVSAHDPAAEEWAKLSETLKGLNKGAGPSTKSVKDLAEAIAQQDGIPLETAKPDPATVYEADVWTYPSNGKFTSVGNTLKLFARTNKEWTSKQIEQAQYAVSYAISGAAWFVKPFHTSFISGMNLYEYTAIIEMHNSGVIDFVIERAKSSLKHALIELGLSGTKQHPPLHKIKAEYNAKKSTNPVPHVMWNTSKPGYIELTGSITQALSITQYDILRSFAYAAFAEFSSDEGKNALSITVKKIPWNKLWISATYADPSKLLKKLPDIGEVVAKKVEAWLLQGNFIGPLAKDLF